MIGRYVGGLLVLVLGVGIVHAQDVPGIEICTAEKTMERRTSCLQSNIGFLQNTITKLALDHQQKLDAANRQIEALKANVTALRKVVDDLKAAQGKTADSAKKNDTSSPKETAAKDDATKDTIKDTTKDGTGKDAAKQVGK